MGLIVLDQKAARDVSVAALGLPDGTAIDSDVVIAAAVRRAASFLCPTRPHRISQTVVDTLRLMDPDPPTLGDRTETILELVVGYGDLVEMETEGDGIQLYLRPPAFVARASGVCFLVGIRPEGADLLGDQLSPLVEYRGHVRFVPAGAGVDVSGALLDSGLQEMSDDQWVRGPRMRSAEEEVRRRDGQLAAAGAAGQILDMKILDGGIGVNYYRGRWHAPDRHTTGRFVARRPQGYGADLWCYAEFQRGQLVRLIDLPTDADNRRGCDEAWRLQAAIDRTAGNPQVVRRIEMGEGSIRFELLAPIPNWLQRRWDLVGRNEASTGCLFAYAFDSSEASQEQAYAEAMMWLQFVPNPGVSSA